jgi:hypothetical protein
MGCSVSQFFDGSYFLKDICKTRLPYQPLTTVYHTLVIDLPQICI